MARTMTRDDLDDLFPTVVRYVGLLLAIVIVVGGVAGVVHREDIASLGVLALGMILYKSVRGARE
jgi:hypothetical protein